MATKNPNRDDKSEQGRQIGQGLAQAGAAQLADDFLHGEGYVRDPECTSRFVQALPMRDVPSKYIVVKPLEQTDPGRDDVKSVTFFVEPDALSALVILANYARPELENVGIPWGAGCQVIGIFAYRELERDHPRALVGLTDISARRCVRGSLGKNVFSFTAPWPAYLEMEKHAEGSFLERETWHSLRR